MDAAALYLEHVYTRKTDPARSAMYLREHLKLVVDMKPALRRTLEKRLAELEAQIPSPGSPAPVHERLLDLMRTLSERTDVTVVRQVMFTSPATGAWKKILPSDMFNFYQHINGLVFRWRFTDAPESEEHGFNFLRLEVGNKVIDPGLWRFSRPREKAKKFTNGFFNAEAAVAPNEDVLMFEGDDSAEGILMFGAGENARFFDWDNDGFIRTLGNSFTTLLERGIARGFGTEWKREEHPDTAKVVARLGTPVAMRTMHNWNPAGTKIP